MRRIIYICVVLTALLTSCEKELDINYHTVDPLYVVEASITENGAVARLSRTLDVTDTLWNKTVDNAVISITSDHGESYVLSLDSSGVYSSSSARGVPGHKYTIRVRIGDYETESTSEMQQAFTVKDIYMYKVQILDDELVSYRVGVSDTGMERNYYYALVTRNGEPYKWHVTDNRGYFGTTEIDISCFRYCDMDMDNKDILQDGEDMAVEVRKVDRKTYDYLYALAIAEGTASNPIRNYTNSTTLGYFTAYSTQIVSGMKFEKDSLKDFEEIISTKIKEK